nr:immunoglobulin heavy chain junction region [Mus musculus]
CATLYSHYDAMDYW